MLLKTHGVLALTVAGLLAGAFLCRPRGEAPGGMYAPLSRAAAERVVGGQYDCPPQDYDTNPLCYAKNTGSCPSKQNPNGPGTVCEATQSGGSYACNFTCPKKNSITGGDTYHTAHANISSKPCPNAPADDCQTVLVQGVSACACVPVAGNKAICGGNYLALTTCARN